MIVPSTQQTISRQRIVADFFGKKRECTILISNLNPLLKFPPAIIQLIFALTHSLAAEDATVVIFAFAFIVVVVVAGVAVAAVVVIFAFDVDVAVKGVVVAAVFAVVAVAAVAAVVAAVVAVGVVAIMKQLSTATLFR